MKHNPTAHRLRCCPVVCLVLLACTHDLARADVRCVDRPETTKRNSYYVSNREPLVPSPLVKLPVGSIEPRGWLRKQLRLQADGFHGHLTEISKFLEKEGNSWLSAKGEGKQGWEEVPYWLKGFGGCGYVLGDQRMIDETKLWIEAAIASQQEDGWFGPDKADRGRRLTAMPEGREDRWPNMIMLFCLQDYYSFTGDKRVIDLMTRFMKYMHEDVPADKVLNGYWPVMRGGDLLYSVYWLYNRTGETWLLDLTEKVHADTARWDHGLINWHCVNIAQAFGEPATYYMQSRNSTDLEAAYRNHRKIRELHGQVPGGMFGGDEGCRPGYDDPRQANETCSMVEEMLSDETLLLITGDLSWADQCEDVAFNSLPAAMTADMKAVRYLTAPNHIKSDAVSKKPHLCNGGAMYLMSPTYARCCVHNCGQGWPYYAQHLWAATPDNGLAAVLYAANRVRAKVAGGEEVAIALDTHYPFDETLRFTVAAAKPVAFPLYLRVPGWCDAAAVSINGEAAKVQARPKSYIVIERTWKDGDTVTLTLPMQVSVRRWTKNHNSASVDRGPLTYSLRIGEEYRRYSVSERNRNDPASMDKWPSWEIYPTTPWNCGLALDESDPASLFTVVKRDYPADDMPFTHEGAPILLKAKGARIPNWKEDRFGLVGLMQDNPVQCDSPLEDITLIPMGAARLRISAFPVIGDGLDAHDWVANPPEPAGPDRYPPLAAAKLESALQWRAPDGSTYSASYCFRGDSVGAMADNIEPAGSSDRSKPKHTFWPHKGNKEWVQVEFPEPDRRVASVSVYWYDDSPKGGCRAPESWVLEYQDGTEWKPVETKDPYGTQTDRFNTVSFSPVQTQALRIRLKLKDGFSGGVLEWKID